MKTLIKLARQPRLLSAPVATPNQLLQPLREVGSMEKTQHWHQDDIMAALRAARLQGIAPERLYANRRVHSEK